MRDRLKLKKGDGLPPLTIETLVNGGAGLARFEGQVVFVPDTVPGDTVRCRVRQAKKQYIQAELVELLAPSEQRQSPLCPVAGECGGCQWQMLPYPQQLQWKERLFRETLERRCGVDPALIEPLVAAPDPWHYRSRVQLKCQQTAAGFVCGFYRSQSRYVVAVDDCPLMPEPLNRLVQQLRNLIDGSRFAAKIPQIDLACDDFSATVASLHYFGNDQVGLETLLKSAGLTAGLQILSGEKRQRRTIQADLSLRIKVGQPELTLSYQAGNFAQINLEQNRALVAEVVRLAQSCRPQTLCDLYCGMGNFSLPLAAVAQQVVGVEDAPGSIDSARHNAVANGIDNVEFICQPAQLEFARLRQVQAFDLVVLDPPRCGACELIPELIQAQPKNIIYISCDPQTLARDLTQLLASGYRMISSQAFDMFPQTFHCESVTFLEYCPA